MPDSAKALPQSSTAASRSGLTYALLAFVLWGLFPLYFRLLSRSSASPITAAALSRRAVMSAGSRLAAGWA